MDYQTIIDLVAEVVKNALPIGIICTFAERLVNMFLGFAFPKWHGGGF